jgi:hypothetical protein
MIGKRIISILTIPKLNPGTMGARVYKLTYFVGDKPYRVVFSHTSLALVRWKLKETLRLEKYQHQCGKLKIV